MVPALEHLRSKTLEKLTTTQHPNPPQTLSQSSKPLATHFSRDRCSRKIPASVSILPWSWSQKALLGQNERENIRITKFVNIDQPTSFQRHCFLPSGHGPWLLPAAHATRQLGGSDAGQPKPACPKDDVKNDRTRPVTFDGFQSSH